MPEVPDRVDFLRRVADAVDLQPHDVGEIVEELDSHLSDAAAAWRDAGLDPDDAERRAVRGLGDPYALGRELGRAHHERRQLLAAVGGAAFHAVVFGIWSYLSLWFVAGGLMLLGGILAWWAYSSLGGSASGWFNGPVASLGTVLITVLWFAWVGWVLPGRVARSANRSVRGVQTAVGVVGFALATWAIWAWVELDMDPVLAIGLPLGPVAFLIASQRPNRGPSLFPETSRRQRAGIALAVILLAAAVGLLTVTPSRDGSWQADLADIGVDPMSLPPLEGGYSIDWGGGPGSRTATASLQIGGPAEAAAFARRYPTLQLEAWPVSHADGRLAFGPAPIATASAPMAADANVRLELPAYRTPVEISTVVVAVAADGTRALIAGPGGPDTTPAWHGTLFDWWFTSG